MNVDTTYSPPVADIDRVRSRALIAGVIGLVAALFLPARTEPQGAEMAG